jgi:lipoprotein-anchoring transpeptidase ErfK/SrfK
MFKKYTTIILGAISILLTIGIVTSIYFITQLNAQTNKNSQAKIVNVNSTVNSLDTSSTLISNSSFTSSSFSQMATSSTGQNNFSAYSNSFSSASEFSSLMNSSLSSSATISSSMSVYSSSMRSLSNADCDLIIAGEYKFGIQNEKVKELQECLRQRGVFKIAENTGYYGNLTQEAHDNIRGIKRNKKEIYISIANQTMTAKENDKILRTSGIVTGKTGFETVTGTFRIYAKTPNTTLRSPFPNISYNLPVKYWMPFYGSYGIHDVHWRTVWGPAADYVNKGSHGCVNTPNDMMEFLWKWADVGTTVIVS